MRVADRQSALGESVNRESASKALIEGKKIAAAHIGVKRSGRETAISEFGS
jgi:hypothetical protein